MGRIRLLSDHTINQIAAGEVIESPASVVKELVENALDAGATKIVIEIKAGGLQLIRVSDDGSGMGREDALLCLERHATSKIREAQDLFSLSTMGFRGEALASIAAISKLSLMTATQEEGTCIEVEAGQILSVQPYARTHGTTIDVRSLFFNVPARKKFQKSAASCSAEITRIVSILSLGSPHVSFELIQQERSALSAPSLGGLNERIEQVLGESFLADTSSLKSVSMQGVIGTPGHTRHNRTGQYLFINGRPVYSPAISYAVRDGYGTMLSGDRHPVYVLHLQVASDLVDVNVHPQKREVRLREEQMLKEEIRKAVALSLQSQEKNSPSPAVFPEELFFSPPKEFKTEPPAAFRFQEAATVTPPTFFYEKKEAKVLGAFAHYLLLDAQSVAERIPLETDSGILLVDLQAARARLLFESLTSLKPGKGESQGLLFPLTVELPLAEAEALIANLPLVEERGIGIRALGKRSFLIDALPASVSEEDVPDWILQLSQGIGNGPEEERIRSLALITCRFARANKKSFMIQEGLALFEELVMSASPLQCPHGNRTMVQLSSYEIAQFFKKK